MTAPSAPLADAAWTLVPTERHVEALAAHGRRARTIRRVVRECASAELPDRIATTPEMTRLLTSRIASVPIQHARALDDAVGRLRRAGTTASALRATGLARGKHLAELVGALDEALEMRGLRDERSSGFHAAAQLGRSAAAQLEWPGGRAPVCGLVRWDPSILAFFEALHARLRQSGDGVSIELPNFVAGPLREAAEAVTAQLESRWSNWNDPPQLSFVNVGPWTRDRARCIEAYDAASEARAVAHSVLEGLERGLSLDRMAIVAADLTEVFLEPLRFELSRAGIPFVEPRGRPAIAAPRAHAALELLRLARGPLSRDALIDVLRVPELRLENWFGGGPHPASELLHELASLPMRFDRTGQELGLELSDRLSELSRADQPRAERLSAAAKGLEQWLAELRLLGEPCPRRELAARASAFFERLGLLQVSERTLSDALRRATQGSRALLQGLGQDALAARAVTLALERTVSAANALGLELEAVELGAYLDELELALEGVTEPRGAARAAALRIARPDEVAGLAWDLVILCRATDASLDRAGSASGVVGAELESQLPIAQRPQQAALEQHFTLFAAGAALMRANELVVTWARHEEGVTLAPSRFAAALRSDVAHRKEPPSPLSAQARRAHAVAVPSSGARERSLAEQARARFFADPSAPSDIFNGEAGPLAAFIGGEAERPLSVTAIERALRCGFLGFTGSVLRATRSDAVEDAIGARERGTLLHAALAVACEAIRGPQSTRSRAELERQALEAARTLLEGKGRSLLRRAGLRATLSDVASLLERILDDESGPPFFAAEQGFGRDAEWPALAVGPWFVSGRVDRIDATNDRQRVRVIDYKTRTPTKSDAAQALQPWLYARKVANELGSRQVEFAYLGLNRRAPRFLPVYSGAADSDDVQQALQRAANGIEMLRAGHLPPRPVTVASCTRCEARDICRRPLSAPEGNEE